MWENGSKIAPATAFWMGVLPTRKPFACTVGWGDRIGVVGDASWSCGVLWLGTELFFGGGARDGLVEATRTWVGYAALGTPAWI